MCMIFGVVSFMSKVAILNLKIKHVHRCTKSCYIPNLKQIYTSDLTKPTQY